MTMTLRKTHRRGAGGPFTGPSHPRR